MQVAFKVKTTSPKKYCVRPSSGIIEAGGSKDVQVIMQAQREYPPSLEDVKDKFLVQYTLAPGVRDVGPDTFDAASNKDIQQTKLRVVLVSARASPHLQPGQTASVAQLAFLALQMLLWPARLVCR